MTNRKTSLDMDSMPSRPPEPPMTLAEDRSGQLNHESIEVPSMADVIRGDAIDQAAFMEEEVDIFLQLQKGEQQSVPVTITVNGVRQHIFRGTPQTIKRKYIEPLARSVVIDYDQPDELVNAGELPRATPSTPYHFTVLRDSPRGIEWLRELQMRG